MRAVAIAIGLAACRHPPVNAISNEDEPDPPVATLPEPVVVVSATRPDLDLSAVLPDPTEELRWPLTMASHPVLEPRFAIAAALAVPGVTWLDLCARGAQNRHESGGHELLDYLRAWCKVEQHDAVAAIGYLKPLTHPVILGMGPAVILDIANILADYGSADDALRVLASDHVTDIEIFDTLAATYVEVGRSDDARQINQLAIDNDAYPHDAVRCHRDARRIVLSEPLSRVPMVEAFRKAQHKAIDPTCIRLVNELSCWAEPADECADYLMDHGLDEKYQFLLAAYTRWPAEPAGYDPWITTAHRAALALPVAGADVLATVAYERAIAASQCLPKRLAAAITDVTQLRAEPKLTAGLEPRIDGLIVSIKQLRGLSATDCDHELAVMAQAPPHN